jgi:hypothetical protein
MAAGLAQNLAARLRRTSGKLPVLRQDCGEASLSKFDQRTTNSGHLQPAVCSIKYYFMR